MLPTLSFGQPVQLTVFYKQKTEIQYKVTLRFQLLQDSPQLASRAEFGHNRP